MLEINKSGIYGGNTAGVQFYLGENESLGNTSWTLKMVQCELKTKFHVDLNLICLPISPNGELEHVQLFEGLCKSVFKSSNFNKSGKTAKFGDKTLTVVGAGIIEYSLDCLFIGSGNSSGFKMGPCEKNLQKVSNFYGLESKISN
jgi:hypothetical protein